jgi:hypothetical protein
VTTYSVPGRGAWTRTGGLLPGKPGGIGRAGYYRLAGLGEAPIGSHYANGADLSHDAYVVYLGVLQIQDLVGLTGRDLDGWFGAQTAASVRRAQGEWWKVDADGIVGRDTMRAALTPLITAISTERDVPLAILGGLLVNESALDPAAVGVNGVDHGLAQINLKAHAATVSLEQALDVQFAVEFSARDLAHIHEVWAGKTKADPWDVAIANHNSPALARQWARSGIAPFIPERVFQIEDYVKRVREAW